MLINTAKNTSDTDEGGRCVCNMRVKANSALCVGCIAVSGYTRDGGVKCSLEKMEGVF